MPDLVDLYPGYASRWIETSAGEIFARVGESGDRRFCCYTATRSRTSCGTAWRHCSSRISRW